MTESSSPARSTDTYCCRFQAGLFFYVNMDVMGSRADQKRLHALQGCRLKPPCPMPHQTRKASF
ncbi:hypothetical protein BURKHO8Y_480050 [Burkholderia sp. 8Y]|nr:hypothetical protein BURKHO8Y_480050 [Burkholderia sp. 8Y]